MQELEFNPGVWCDETENLQAKESASQEKDHAQFACLGRVVEYTRQHQFNRERELLNTEKWAHILQILFLSATKSQDNSRSFHKYNNADKIKTDVILAAYHLYITTPAEFILVTYLHHQLTEFSPPVYQFMNEWVDVQE